MADPWQLFDEDGNAIADKGAGKEEVFGRGLLHGASHVWIWRRTVESVEVLLQKRAASKRTWPNKLDISAAGHIDLGEDAITAAQRETKEEIGLDVSPEELEAIGRLRAHMVASNGSVENEFQWLYLFELKSDQKMELEESEVESVQWKAYQDFKREVTSDVLLTAYVPHSADYFRLLLENLDRL